MGLCEGRRVTVADVGNSVNSGEVGIKGGPSSVRAGGGEGLFLGLGGGGAGGSDAGGGREGAVLIRCDRSRTEEVMGARDAVISSLLGTELATELTESWM